MASSYPVALVPAWVKKQIDAGREDDMHKLLIERQKNKRDQIARDVLAGLNMPEGTEEREQAVELVNSMKLNPTYLVARDEASAVEAIKRKMPSWG